MFQLYSLLLQTVTKTETLLKPEQLEHPHWVTLTCLYENPSQEISTCLFVTPTQHLSRNIYIYKSYKILLQKKYKKDYYI